MGPELAIPVIVALLWGPTGVWLAFRTLRRHRGQGTVEISSGVSELVRGSRLARGEILALVESDGFWICATCRSLNRREAIRCYSCRTPASILARQVSAPLPALRPVPVMAENVAPGRAAPAQAPAQLAPLPVSRGVPVMARGVARDLPAPAPLPALRPVPVMARGVAAGLPAPVQASAPLPVSRGVPVMAEAVAAGRQGRDRATGQMPVMAEGVGAGRPAPAPLPVMAEGVGAGRPAPAPLPVMAEGVGAGRPAPAPLPVMAEGVGLFSGEDAART